MLYQPEEEGVSGGRSVESSVLTAVRGVPLRSSKSLLVVTLLLGVLLLYFEGSAVSVYSSGGTASSELAVAGRGSAASSAASSAALSATGAGGEPSRGADESADVAAVIQQAQLTRLKERVAKLEMENAQLLLSASASSAITVAAGGAQGAGGRSSGGSGGSGDGSSSLSDPASARWRRHRIYCMVPTMYQPLRLGKLRAVAVSWGKRCDVIKFFIDPAPAGETYPTHFEVEGGRRIEMVQVPIVRKNDVMVRDKKYANKSCTFGSVKLACRNIWEKVWRSWVYVFEHDVEQADWFFKIDDDTFVFTEFLKMFIEAKGWAPEQDRYFGHVSYLSVVPFVNGAIVGISRGTLRKVGPLYRSMPQEYGSRDKFARHRCVDREGANQEITEAICMSKLGIKATPTIDPHGLMTVSLFRLSDSLYLRKRPGTTSWFWFGRSPSEVCCSLTPLAFHWYKHSEDLLRIDSLFYNESDHTVEDRFFSRVEADQLLADPKAGVPALISHGVDGVPRWKIAGELEYFFQVKSRLREMGIIGGAVSAVATDGELPPVQPDLELAEQEDQEQPPH
jgi:hypothetical protein